MRMCIVGDVARCRCIGSSYTIGRRERNGTWRVDQNALCCSGRSRGYELSVFTFAGLL